jgi:hypothetical protein
VLVSIFFALKELFMRAVPKFTCFKTEREAVSSRALAAVHVIGAKVLWCDYETTARDVVKQCAKPFHPQVRIFPCDNYEKAQELAKVLA